MKLAPSSFLPVTTDVIYALMAGLGDNWPISRFITDEVPGFGRACLELPFEYAFTARGFQFRSDELNLILSYQPNLVGITWFRGSDGPDYPRFEILEEKIRNFVSLIASISDIEELSFHACNLTYQNFLKTASYPTGEELSHYFIKKFCFPAIKNNDIVHEQNVCWKEKCGTDYRIKLKTVALESEGTEEDMIGLDLTTTAGRVFQSQKSFPHTELLQVHKVLNDKFRNALTSKAKKEWQLNDDTK